MTSTAERGTRDGGLARAVDCVRLPVPDLDQALVFYRDLLGHRLIWRSETAAGLRLDRDDAELVLQTERPELEVDLLVDDAAEAAARFTSAGGTVTEGPFDIAIGRCVVVRDPWGNELVLLDARRGRLVTDAEGRIRGATLGAVTEVGGAGRV